MFYYFDDGTKCTSKIEAIKYGLAKQLTPKFYYYDHIYEKLNWSVEPSQSLDYYYKEQAQNIRDNYDYVILAYSGGYDSTNILETFHFNNIKLDKILIVGAFKQDSSYGVDENHNGELYHNAFPYVKDLGLDHITQVIDYTELFDSTKNFSISVYNENWVDTIGAWFSPHNWFWKDVERHIVPLEWRGKRVALVFGKDKPGLYHNVHATRRGIGIQGDALNPTGFHFRDTPCLSYADTNADESIDRVNFYWDPENPQILLKQLHVIKRVTEINEIAPLKLLNINEIVYSLKRPLLFKSPKSGSNLFSLRDEYLKTNKASDVFSLYAAGINKIDREIGVSNIGPIFSKHYSMLSGLHAIT